jgi:hypothetical protein
VPEGTRLQVEQFSRPLYLKATVVNEGRAPGRLREVGLSTGEDTGEFVAADQPVCGDEPCAFPLLLQPGDTVTVLMRITGEMLQPLRCNAFAEREGLAFEQHTTTEEVSWYGTEVRVPSSNDCPPGTKPR